jgi:hypothetical protein
MNSKLIAFLFACAFSLSAYADAPASLTVTPAVKGNVFTVSYRTASTGNVKISILNKSNQVVFSEVLRNVASFERPYNFSELTVGEYTVIVENKNGRQEEKINHFNASVKTFTKVSELSADRYLLNVACTGTEEMTLRIYDNTAGLLHEQYITVNGNYGLIYNLSNVKSPATTIVIFEITTASGQVITEMF